MSHLSQTEKREDESMHVKNSLSRNSLCHAYDADGIECLCRDSCVCCTSKNTAVLISIEATFPTLTDYCVSGGRNLGERPLQ